MIYSWCVNYEYTHYHFYSLLGYGSAENQPLPYCFHLSRSSGPCVCKPRAGIQTPGARQLLLRLLRLLHQIYTAELPPKSCLPEALDGAFPTFPITCYRNTEEASASHRCWKMKPSNPPSSFQRPRGNHPYRTERTELKGRSLEGGNLKPSIQMPATPRS